MARYRTYKNGIYGHRYMGYYIIKNDKNDFEIINENKAVMQKDIRSYDDCEWEIDKITASEADLRIMESLYKKEIFQLSALFVELMEKKEQDGLDESDRVTYKWVEKIRKRKAEEKDF